MIVAGILGVLASCGSTGDGKPDTGYGGGQAAPATINCVDLCQRVADCAVHLCDEDKNTTQYLAVLPLLASQCESACTDAQVSGAISPTQWQCTFHDTCRMVLGNDACGTPNTSYICQ